MKHEVRVRFDGSDIPGGASAVLGLAGIGPDVSTIEDVPFLGQVEVWVTLEKTDPRLEALFRLLKERGCEWLEDHNDRYTDQEMEAARLFVMQSNGDCEIDGGAQWGTAYDLAGACPACGTGCRQTSALFVDGRQLSTLEGRRAASTYFWHHLVDEGLAAELERIGVTGLSFRSVYAVMEDGRQVKLRWKQMVAAKTLPPMAPKSLGFTRNRACQVCHRNGYFQAPAVAPSRFVYRETDLEDADDVNVSWENVGFAILKPDLRQSLLSRPWMIVSPKVRRAFLEAGVSCFWWTPVLVDAAD